MWYGKSPKATTDKVAEILEAQGIEHRRCGFCGMLYTPPEVPRVPSQACLNCWIEIQAQMGVKRER